jgi:hypothetical protein
MSKIDIGKIVFVLHHTNQGTPESGEIHSIYTTEAAAEEAMAAILNWDYDGVTMQENEDEDYIYMYISQQVLKN